MVKTKLIFILTLLFIGGTVFFSCSKSEESPAPQIKQPTTNNNTGDTTNNNDTIKPPPPPPPPPPPIDTTDTTAMVTYKTWVVKYVRVANNPVINHPMLGGIYEFKSDSTYKFIESNPGWPSENGTWYFDSNARKKLYRKYGSNSAKEWMIQKIDLDSMIIQTPPNEGSFHIKLKRQ